MARTRGLTLDDREIDFSKGVRAKFYRPGARITRIPDQVDVRAIRERTGASQSEFASRYGFSLRTLQEWEQGRAQPDTAVRAYLLVIARKPRAVEQALGL